MSERIRGIRRRAIQIDVYFIITQLLLKLSLLCNDLIGVKVINLGPNINAFKATNTQQ